MSLVAGCAGLPVVPSEQKTVTAVGETGTPLARLASPIAAGMSGVAFMPEAHAALEARLRLVDSAQASVDVQYYLIGQDDTGNSLLEALLRASRRGVKVRLIIDDLYTAGQGPLLGELGRQANFEVRVFNPFVQFRDDKVGRLIGSIGSASRVDFRMHNKLLVVDGNIAVVGGRNMADEYFMAAQDADFLDADLILSGSTVTRLAAVFDEYWNSDVVYPVQLLEEPHDAAAEFARIDGARNRMESKVRNIPPFLAPYAHVADDLWTDKFTWTQVSDVTVVADSPDKRFQATPDSPGLVLDTLVERLRDTKSSVVLISPYVIPGKRGLELLKDLRKKGVSITLITNSLGSNDEELEHFVYARYRKAMLEMGVHIRELSPVLSRKWIGLGQSTTGRLHAKVAVLDHRWVYMGSLNLDRRSAFKNTEDGIFIDSPALAAQIEGLLDPQYSYVLRLEPVSGDISWIETSPQGPIVYKDEPGKDFSDWLQQNILGNLIPEAEF